MQGLETAVTGIGYDTIATTIRDWTEAYRWIQLFTADVVPESRQLPEPRYDVSILPQGANLPPEINKVDGFIDEHHHFGSTNDIPENFFIFWKD